MLSILIVQLSSGRWSFALVKDDRRIYSSNQAYETPDECWEHVKEILKDDDVRTA